MTSLLSTSLIVLTSNSLHNCLKTSTPRIGGIVVRVMRIFMVCCRYTRLQLDQATREEIGRQAKRVLDYGRLKYLEEVTNLDIQLKYYVDPFISLENALIVCSRPGTTG